jgi:ribosomal protein S18 acetylase RimI-like enzyme
MTAMPSDIPDFTTVPPGAARDAWAALLDAQETLIASWDALAQTSPGARVIRSSTAVAAVFPSWAPLNNAILLHADDGRSAAAAASQVTSVYADAGVDTWAVWLPSRADDLDAPDEVQEVEELQRDTTTLVMTATLPETLRFHDGVVGASIAAATRAAGDAPVPVRDLGDPPAPPGLAAWVMVREGEAVAGAWSFLHGTGCGIYTVGTLPGWRRQGIARSLVEHALAAARCRGARTASLQSTRMGQALYASLGFEPVGRYEEWIPR